MATYDTAKILIVDSTGCQRLQSVTSTYLVPFIFTSVFTNTLFSQTRLHKHKDGYVRHCKEYDCRLDWLAAQGCALPVLRRWLVMRVRCECNASDFVSFLLLLSCHSFTQYSKPLFFLGSIVVAGFFMTVTVAPFDMMRTRLMNQPPGVKQCKSLLIPRL
jgi:hypothetical protein